MPLNAVFIYLDDVRNPPSDTWDIARTAEEAYTLILGAYNIDRKRPIVVSLDHDLGRDSDYHMLRTTGYDLLTWLEKDIATNAKIRPQISFLIHSANPVGRARMEMAIASIERLLNAA